MQGISPAAARLRHPSTRGAAGNGVTSSGKEPYIHTTSIFYGGKNPQKGTTMKKIFSKISNILSNERGEGAFLDVVIIAVVVVVIGCLLMTLMKQLYSGTVFPKFKTYIENLFSYANSYTAGVGSGVVIS